MSEKTPRPNLIIEGSDQKTLIESIADLLVKMGKDRSEALMEIANATDEIGQERKHLAVERNLPETATWNDIIAYDERQKKN